MELEGLQASAEGITAKYHAEALPTTVVGEPVALAHPVGNATKELPDSVSISGKHLQSAPPPVSNSRKYMAKQTINDPPPEKESPQRPFSTQQQHPSRRRETMQTR